ncbi:MAG: glutathione S-transferase [Rhodanobacteraceae bacterium]|nr:glutathione S-transferase [Rhodanobacteraceae bacterium]
MITVHHLNNSRSQRILWLLEELGVDYTIVHHQRDAKTMLAPASLKAVHPLGKSPVIVDGDNTLAESGAIIEYLADTYGKALGLAPEPGTPERLRYSYWLHYAEGSAMPPLLMSLIFSKIKSAPMPFYERACARSQVPDYRVSRPCGASRIPARDRVEFLLQPRWHSAKGSSIHRPGTHP